MLDRLKQRLRDVRTIKILCQEAEKQANANGQREPGSEHFIMAALGLPDGTARRAFQRIAVDPDLFFTAVSRQYNEALRSVGIDLPKNVSQPVAIHGHQGIYKAQESSQVLLKKLSELKKPSSHQPLLSAHVILAAASAQYGVTPRALQSMGVEPVKLTEAARAELAYVGA